MQGIDYRTMAEEWLDHIVQQYHITHVCRKDLLLIEYLLKKGYTLIAVKDESNVLRVDFLIEKSQKQKELRDAKRLNRRCS